MKFSDLEVIDFSLVVFYHETYISTVSLLVVTYSRALLTCVMKDSDTWFVVASLLIDALYAQDTHGQKETIVYSVLYRLNILARLELAVSIVL